MNKIYNILLFFSAVLSYSQVTIDVKTNKRDFSENEEVIVNVLLEVSGQNVVQRTPLRLFDTSKFHIVGNGSEQNTFIDQKTGFKVNQTLFQWVLKPKKTGKVKIGSVSVIVDDKLYYTEPFDILVRESEKKSVAVDNSVKEVYLNVEVDNKEVYTNQPTVAVLRAYSRNFDNFRKVKNIRLPQQNNINIKPVSYQKSEIEPSGEMASQVLAVFMIFPNESGRVEVAPVSANISNKDTKIVSNKIKLNVKKLPKNSPANYKNAVGTFVLKVENDELEVPEIEKPLNVFVKLSGVGNFGNIDLPKIKNSADYNIFQPKILKNTVSGKTGMRGEVIAHYIVVPKKAGNLKIATENFSYFNPEAKEYVDLGSKTLNLTVKTHSEILADRTTLERVNEYTNNVLETVDNPVIQTSHLKVKHKNNVNWKALFINTGILSFLLLGFLLFKNIQKNSQKNKNSVPKKPTGSIAETEKEIKESLKTDVNDYFSYLRNLLQNGDYDGFFKTVEEMDKETQGQYFVEGKEDFKTVLEKMEGRQISEQYHNITQKIQMEKYAPIHLPEQMEELMTQIENLYSQISK